MVTRIVRTVLSMVTRRAAGGAQTGRFDGPHGAEGTPVAETGTITAVGDLGFGYIARDGAIGRDDLFFHRSEVAGDGFARLREGQRVSFDEEADPRDRNRPRAVNVRPTGEA